MQEKRRHARARIDTPLLFQVKGKNREKPGVARDISVGGVFIETDAPAAFGSEVLIRIRLQGSEQALLLRGTVRWVQGTTGMGVQFGLLGALETHLITELAKKAQG